MTEHDDPRLAALHDAGILDTSPEPAFDDVARLAATICNAPVALVSLVDSDRQWFKARIGFPTCETDLDRSVCRFVVDAADMIVIPDLEADPRTCDNPLVTGEPHVRFYAGAPLVASGGQVLGALCVLDHARRPDGLSPEQTEGLGMLARRVVEAIEMRRLARDFAQASTDRDRAERERAANDRRWHQVFKNLNEGFILGRLVRDECGRVVDWRYEEVNDAWYDLVGIPRGGAVGRTIREVFPGIEDEWVMEFAGLIEGGDPIRFTRQVGVLGRWYDGAAQHAGDDRFTVIFLEATARIQAERRQAATVELGDRLRDAASVEDIAMAASRILGHALDVELVGYGDIDPDAETISIAHDWTAEQVQTLAGTHNLRDFGSYVEDLKRGETVIIRDSRTDPRTRAFTSALENRHVRAFVNAPVFEHGSFVALLYVATGQPRDWTVEELDFIRDVAYRARLAIERCRAERQQAILNGEIAHRMKNSLAIVQAIANQTLRASADPDRLHSFNQRLQALGTAHDALLGKNLMGASLPDIIDRVLGSAGIDGRYRCDGEPMQFGARATLSTSLLLHELATNALKYGSLSTNGAVLLRWRQTAGDGGGVMLEWIEEGGPPATAPVRKGFGSRLLSFGLVGTGGSTLRYDHTGFSAEFVASLEHMQSA